MSVQNLEEAATIASEFVSSLDNLPSEVQFLLQEIKHKESRSQDIQQEIAKESAKYIRHSLRVPSPGPGGCTPGPNPKSHLPPKIAGWYAEVNVLADEKQQLAQRIVGLITRTKARLEADLARVGVLQGGEVVEAAAADVYGGRSAAVQINESLRSALEVVPASVPKKRRMSSIKLPSPIPRSRRHVEEEEGEEGEGDEEGDGEDKGIYCFCQKQSFGEMIACDNKGCVYQWFHVSCVNLKQPPPEQWFCSGECKGKGSLRKAGRKK